MLSGAVGTQPREKPLLTCSASGAALEEQLRVPAAEASDKRERQTFVLSN